MRSSAAAKRIVDKLAELYPGATTELHYRTPFELLVATILSAQSTDARVNMVTPSLFTRFPNAAALAKADASELERLIVSTGFFRQKSKALLGMAAILVERHSGEVPADMDALTTLPGVGRKTANVVLGHALGVPGLPVDRHVLRVSNRIGIAEGDEPVAVETQLCERLPQDRWTLTSDVLILHGRRVCRPKPECERCPLPPDDCAYYVAVLEGARKGIRTKPPGAKKKAGKKTGKKTKGARR
jgi:endonuclease III